MRNHTTKMPPVRRFGFYFAMAIILALSLQLLIYVLLLDNTIGPFSLASLGADIHTKWDRTVGLVVSPSTARVAPSHVMEVEQWETFFRINNLPFRRVEEQDLGDQVPDVLVLPDVECLSDASLRALQHHLDVGGGIIASGPVGVRDEQGTWRGWEFFTFLTGTREPKIEASGSPAFVSFRGDSIFSEALPAGHRLSLLPQDLTIVRANSPDAYWSDWKLRPMGTGILDTTLAARTYHGTGRVLWFGFNPAPASLMDRPELLLSSLRWTSKQPMAVKASWPEGKAAGLVLAQELQGNPQDAAGVIRYLQAERVPSTLLVDAKVALSEEVRSSKSVDFAWLSDRSRSLTTLPAPLQTAILVLGRRSAENMIGRPVYGGAVPYGLVTSETPEALNAAGYRYYFERLNVTSAVPELIEFPISLLFPFQKSYVARIFATGDSDFQAIAHFEKPDATDVALEDTFVRDMDRLVSIRGLYTLYFHTYLLGSPEYQRTLHAVVQDAKRRDLWLADASEVTDWWIARHNVEVDLEQVGPRRFRLGITNRGDRNLKGFSVRLYLPFTPSDVDLEPALLQLDRATSSRVPNEDAIDVLFPNLKGQTHYPLMIRMD